MPWHTALGMMLAVVVLAVDTPPARAAAGDLDPTFGVGGKVTTDFGGPDQANALVVQADGKIVVAGVGGQTFDRHFALARYAVDGTLDTSFGTGGEVVTSFGPTSTDAAYAILLQPDGKLVAVGGGGSGNTPNIAVARYNTDGTLDPGFGDGGKAIVPWGGNLQVRAGLLQPDGKIVVIGSTGVIIGPSGLTASDLLLVRLDTDGTLDGTFGTDGSVVTDFGAVEQGLAGVLQPDGKIVVAGQSLTNFDEGEFLLVRYDSDGSVDGTFGTGGKVTTSFGGEYQYAPAVVIQPDGKLIAGGVGGNLDFALARYDPDGTLDSTFGNAGKVITHFQVSQINAVALQPDGKIVAAGFSEDLVAGGGQWALARYGSDGSIDAIFAACPQVLTQLGPFGGFAMLNAVALQSDGKIVAAGVSGTDFAVVRYGGPSPSCQAALAQGASITLRDGASDVNDSILWKWTSAGPVAIGDFGDPNAGSLFDLCVIDHAGGGLRQSLAAFTERGGWRVAPGRLRFKPAPMAEPLNGIVRVQLVAGPAGKAKIRIKGSGANLHGPVLPATPPVAVRLVRHDAPLCWEATFGAHVTRNDAAAFQARSD